MTHLGRCLRDSASVIDFGQLPSASPLISCHLNHSDSTLDIRAKATAVNVGIIFLYSAPLLGANSIKIDLCRCKAYLVWACLLVMDMGR